MSIAILRAFVHKRKEEHAAFCSKKIKRGGQNAEETQASEVIEGNDMCQNTKSNGNGKMLLSDPDQPVDGPTVLDEPIKGQGKLKPLRVLEVYILYNFECIFNVHPFINFAFIIHVISIKLYDKLVKTLKFPLIIDTIIL